MPGREPLPHFVGRVIATPLADDRVLPQLPEAFGNAFGAVGTDEEPAAGALDGFDAGAAAWLDHRDAAGHGFEHREPLRLARGGRDREGVELSIERDLGGAAERAVIPVVAGVAPVVQPAL